ncbi:MAG: hypothetical protein ABI768_11465 [Acidobacteriota bacterium]
MRAAAVLFSALLLAAPGALVQTAPVVKAGTGTTRTLSDLARERRLLGRPAVSGTFSVAGVAGGPLPLSASAIAHAAANAGAEEAALRSRYQAATSDASAARADLALAETYVPHFVSWGPRPGRGHAAADRAAAAAVRESAVLPYRMRLREADAGVAAVKEDASRAGLPGAAR